MIGIVSMPLRSPCLFTFVRAELSPLRLAGIYGQNSWVIGARRNPARRIHLEGDALNLDRVRILKDPTWSHLIWSHPRWRWRSARRLKVNSLIMSLVNWYCYFFSLPVSRASSIPFIPPSQWIFLASIVSTCCGTAAAAPRIFFLFFFSLLTLCVKHLTPPEERKAILISIAAHLVYFSNHRGPAAWRAHMRGKKKGGGLMRSACCLQQPCRRLH